MCLEKQTDKTKRMYKILPMEFTVYKVISNTNSFALWHAYNFQTGLNKCDPVKSPERGQAVTGITPRGINHRTTAGGFGCFKTIHMARKANQNRLSFDRCKIIKCRVRKSDIIHFGMWGRVDSLALHVKCLWINSLDEVT